MIARPVGPRRRYHLDPAGVDAIRVYFEQLWQQSLGAFKLAAEQQQETTMVGQAQIAEPPVRRSVRVEVPSEKAFAVFAESKGEWWPSDFRLGAEPIDSIVIEPVAGRRWYERDASGAECE